MVGDADKDEVGVAGTHLLAGPALGAFVDARLGADSFPHVLDAPARLAMAIFGALVEEAAFAGEAVELRNIGNRFKEEDVHQVEFGEVGGGGKVGHICIEGAGIVNGSGIVGSDAVRGDNRAGVGAGEKQDGNGER